MCHRGRYGKSACLQTRKKVDLKVGVGDPVHKYRGTATEIALSSGKFVKEERSAEGFGMAYIASAQPIFEGGRIIGVVSAIISNEKWIVCVYWQLSFRVL